MNNKKLVFLSIISLAFLALLMVSVTFAWFYFPSSKNLIINTLDFCVFLIENNLYKQVAEFF